MRSISSGGGSHRERSRAWTAIGVAVVLVGSFGEALRAQQSVELKEIKIEALGPTVLTKNELPVRVTAVFSDGSETNVTDTCKWIANVRILKGDDPDGFFPSGLYLNGGTVAVGKNEARRSFTIQASYVFNGQTKHAKLKFKIHDDYALVPMLLYMEEQKAKRTLEAAGLNPRFTYSDRFNPYLNPYDVMTVGHNSDVALVRKGTTVSLEINPEPYPEVIGKTEEEARQILEKKGLKVDVIRGRHFNSTMPTNVVALQLPAGMGSDKEVSAPPMVRGTTVKLYINEHLPQEAQPGQAAGGSTTGPSPTPGTGASAGPQPGGTPSSPQQQLPRMGIVVFMLVDGNEVEQPLSRTYPPGSKLFFREALDRKPPGDIIYTWYIDGRRAGAGRTTGERFQPPGPHYVQLVAECKTLGWTNAIIRNIHIEYPPDAGLGIRITPVTVPFEPGQQIDLIAVTTNLPKGKLTWYVNEEKVGTGPRVNKFLLKEKGDYDIVLAFQEDDENFESLKAEKRIVVGDPPIGLMGSHVNRFRTDGVPEQVRIASSYWKGGYTASQGIGSVVTVTPGWSDFVRFSDVGAVEALDLYTGLQMEGHNTGFLVYIPKGKNAVHYQVCGFRFGDPGKTLGAFKGYVRYAGKIPIKGGQTVIPQTLRWIERHARCGVAEWQTQEGSICRVRIWKTESAGQMGVITPNVVVKGGVEYLGCERYDPSTDPGTGTTAAGIATATQAGGQFQTSLIPPGSTGQTAQTGQPIPGWYIKPGGQPPGAGGGIGSGGAGSGNLGNLSVSQTNVTVTLWDHGREDGDIVNIYLDGNLIRGNMILKNTRQNFNVNLNPGSNRFEVEAVNEGRIPPNTASVNISHVTAGPATQIYQRRSGARASMVLTAP